jgi:hypothetical protein
MLQKYDKMCKHILLIISLTIWPHRLTVRTPGSHPDNRGSIPREVTKERTSSRMAFFLW